MFINFAVEVFVHDQSFSHYCWKFQMEVILHHMICKSLKFDFNILIVTHGKIVS